MKLSFLYQLKLITEQYKSQERTFVLFKLGENRDKV
jgi:hypothetical protein